MREAQEKDIVKHSDGIKGIVLKAYAKSYLIYTETGKLVTWLSEACENTGKYIDVAYMISKI